MDQKASSLEPVCGQMPNQYMHDVSWLSQPHEIGLHHHSIQKHGDRQTNLKKRPGIHHARKKIAKSSIHKSNCGGLWRMSDHVIDLESQVPVAAASKEYMNQQMGPFWLKNVIHPEICDVNSNKEAINYSDSSSQYSCFGCFIHPSTVFNMLGTNDNNDFGFSGGHPSDGYDKRVTPRFIVRDEQIFSPLGINQVSNEITPSDGHQYSHAGPSDGGLTYHGTSQQYIAEPSSGNCIQQAQQVRPGGLNISRGLVETDESMYRMGFASLLGENLELPYSNVQIFPEDKQRTPESVNVLASAYFDTPRSTCEGLSQSHPPIPGSQKWHSQQFGEPFKIEAQSPYINATVTGKAPMVSQLRSEQSHGFHNTSLESSPLPVGPTGASRFEDSSISVLHNVLRAYIEFKSMPVNSGETQIPFVNYIHSMACKDRLCICEQCCILVFHFDNCSTSDCNICMPVRSLCGSGELPNNDISKGSCGRYLNPPVSKRLKMDNSFSFKGGFSHANFPCNPFSPERLPQLQQWDEATVSDTSDVIKVISELVSVVQDPTEVTSNDVEDDVQILECKTEPFLSEELIVGCEQWEAEDLNISEIISDLTCSSQVSTDFDLARAQTKGDSFAPVADFDSGMKTEEQKLLGVSLTDFFTAEQMKEHISSLNHCVDQVIMKDLLGDTVAQHSMGENTCQLCNKDKLFFAPEPKYCSCCGACIKHNLLYYRGLDEIGTQHSFCALCFRESRGGKISFQGGSISKEKLHKERNSDGNEESWVLCDKCEHWQHQICALYNLKKDLEGKAEYTCPKCCLGEIENGQRTPLPKAAAFGAKDLPRSMLSDYIEERLFRRLKQEREERAKALKKDLDEVPVAADLVVRVVLSVEKQLKVKQRLLDIFHDESYPEEFPYKTKVILLFQKIQGVDVCLFAMYVKEFGSECSRPNQRCVYISYIDSVKYFTPEIRTVTGEALRTFVYHEILIGYLDYCKRRGFATCYIWSCSPLKGEDYILYCHPENQKRPKSDKLRHWYKSMLKKAVKEDIVVDITNLYDHFFVPAGECNTKISATRLPYFDDYYWSNAAEDMIRTIEQESGEDTQGKVKKVVTQRTLKALGHNKSSGGAAKDVMLMQKLGQNILPVKEDFIMVHLQYFCTHCHEPILSGSRWFCKQSKNFQLCARCHDMELNLNGDSKHTCCSGERHLLRQVLVNDVPIDTDDKDVNLDNSFLKDRHVFLSFFQENHYQFDTLRRAKHSSMMLLYHLQNPIALSVGNTCSICHENIMTNQSWHCNRCPDFDVCNACYEGKGCLCHIHELTQRSFTATCGSNKKQPKQQKTLQES